MNRTSPTEGILNALLQQSASQVLSWLEAVWTRQVPEPQDFNWLGLAEATASNALHAHTRDESMAWARVAISTYDRLAQQSSSASERLSLVLSDMNVRAGMIVRYGAVSGDAVLDARFVTDAFDRNVHLSYEEAAHKATLGQTLSLEDMRALRRIKNLMAPIALLAKHGRISVNSYWKEWLLLQKNLV